MKGGMGDVGRQVSKEDKRQSEQSAHLLNLNVVHMPV